MIRQLAGQGAVPFLISARYLPLCLYIQLALGTRHPPIQWVLGLCSHGERFTTHIHLASRLRMYRVIPPHTLYDLMVCTVTLLFSAKNSWRHNGQPTDTEVHSHLLFVHVNFRYFPHPCSPRDSHHRDPKSLLNHTTTPSTATKYSKLQLKSKTMELDMNGQEVMYSTCTKMVCSQLLTTVQSDHHKMKGGRKACLRYRTSKVGKPFTLKI